MAIKIFEEDINKAGWAERVAISVNNFMNEFKLNMPVRTDVSGNKYVATVFYNIDFTQEIPTQTFIMPQQQPIQTQPSQPQQAPVKDEPIGALWVWKNGVLNGNFKGGKLKLINEQALTQQGFTKIITENNTTIYNGKIDDEKGVPVAVRVIKMKEKKSERSPDFVIFEDKYGKQN